MSNQTIMFFGVCFPMGIQISVARLHLIKFKDVVNVRLFKVSHTAPLNMIKPDLWQLISFLCVYLFFYYTVIDGFVRIRQFHFLPE